MTHDSGDAAAFPAREIVDNPGGFGQTEVLWPGLTKRELIAAMAMQGLLAAVYSSKEMLDEFTRDEMSRRHMTGCVAVTKVALNYADALLRELSRPEPGASGEG